MPARSSATLAADVPAPSLQRTIGRYALRYGTTGVALAAASIAASATAASADDSYEVRSGDTVSQIARDTGTSAQAIRAANSLDAQLRIRAGQTLTIPSGQASTAPTQASAAAPAGSHTVVTGDTVSGIARSYGTTASAIVSANGLDSRAFIRAGQVLTIPSGQSSPAPAQTSTTSTASGSSHTVVAGDTVSGIARAYGTTQSAIVSANGLDARGFIRAGQTLTIPGAGGGAGETVSTVSSPAAVPAPTQQLVGDTFLGRTYSRDVVSAANTNKATLNASQVPSKSDMKDLVRSTARAHGVDPALALAIATQESGFDQRAVSPANAIGTMQVIPSSGDWASEMVGRELNLLDPQDNVTAGVAILGRLLATSPSTDTAIAGYYQGQSSVRNNGMFDDTRRYVANVQTLANQYR